MPTCILGGTSGLGITPENNLTISGGARLFARDRVAPSAGLRGSSTLYNVPPIQRDKTPAPPPGTWDIRLYDKFRNRLAFPRELLTSVSFVHSERGGYESGTVQMSNAWNPFAYEGTEFAEVWLFGVRLFRGWLRVINNNLEEPKNREIQLYGLMQILDGYMVRRHYCYAVTVSVDKIFTQLITDYARPANRLPNIEIDVTGVAALGLTVAEFDGSAKTLPQAINSLLDLFPDALIWGCDVNPITGADRAYLRPRATQTLYTFAIGESTKVTAELLPKNVTTIRNILFITGGKIANPNVIMNGDFSQCIIPDATEGNLLQNAGFETRSSDPEFPDFWGFDYRGRAHSSDRFPDRSHSGSAWVNLDNYDDGGPEAVYQRVPLYQLAPFQASVWAQQEQVGQTTGFTLYMRLFDSSNKFYGQAGMRFTPPANGNYAQFIFPFTFADTPDANILEYKIVIDDSASHWNGVNFDDCALIIGLPIAKGWQAGQSLNAIYVTLDWFNREVPPCLQSDSAVKVQLLTESTPAYVEIKNSEAGRANVTKNTTYNSGIFVYTAMTTQITLGVRLYDTNGVLQKTYQSDIINCISEGQWVRAEFPNWRTGIADETAEFFIRMYTPIAPLWLSCAYIVEPPTPANYVLSDTYSAVRRVTDYSALDIGTDALGSIATFGDREDSVSNDSIVDDATADSFAKGYFKANAAPTSEGTLTIIGASAPIGFDGKVRLVNLPDAPAPLIPVRVTYTIAENITIRAELNNKKPTLDGLFRLLAQSPYNPF